MKKKYTFFNFFLDNCKKGFIFAKQFITIINNLN